MPTTADALAQKRTAADALQAETEWCSCSAFGRRKHNHNARSASRRQAELSAAETDILNEAKALAQRRLPRLLLILFNRQDEHAPIGSALGILDACLIDSLVQTRVVRQIHHLRHIFAPRSLLAST